jgi:hypothetical protein
MLVEPFTLGEIKLAVFDIEHNKAKASAVVAFNTLSRVQVILAIASPQ